MTMDVVSTTSGALSVELAGVIANAREYAAHSKAINTLRAYRTDWNDFTAWCASHNLQSMPSTSEVVALYIVALKATCSVSTLQRRIATISQANRAAGHAPVSVRNEPLHSVWRGITKAHGTAQKGKAPAVTDELRLMVANLPDNLLGLRDRALLLVGFAGAFRRSELVGLDVTDAQFAREGLIVTLRRSKTDQEGAGRMVGLTYGSNPATCPVRALQAWLEASGITEGALFRFVNRHGQVQDGRLSDQTVALVVKRYAQAAGLDPARYSGHSLRSGMATSAAARGASERSIMNQTGHKSVTMVRRYIREGSLFRENAAAMCGL